MSTKTLVILSNDEEKELSMEVSSLTAKQIRKLIYDTEVSLSEQQKTLMEA